MPRSRSRSVPPLSEPPFALHDRAEADLAFVRATVERSALFSSVPGIAGIAMGVTALAAAATAALQSTRREWLLVWSAEAVIGAAIGLYGIVRKAQRRKESLGVGPARRFALGLLPPIVAGGALTVACLREGAPALLPPVWLLCYGIAILGAGAVSAARAVPLLGAAFVVAGLAAIASPVTWGDAYMAMAFGIGHIVAGAIVARHHGG